MLPDKIPDFYHKNPINLWSMPRLDSYWNARLWEQHVEEFRDELLLEWTERFTTYRESN